MDSETLDVEAIRAECKAMARPEFLELATKAGLRLPTAEKFRNGHITELGGSKLLRLAHALKANRPESA